MHKRQLHHLLVKLRPISYWYFLGLSVLFFVIFVLAFRQNNVTMLSLRYEVFKADEAGGDIEGALRKLRAHVYAHMNTDLTPKEDSIHPPIQLKNQYERLVKTEKERVAKINEKVYTDAQAECERKLPTGRIADRVPCVQEYVNANTVREMPIPDGLYKFDFVSPRWSFDRAGLSLLASVLFFILFLARWLLDRWIVHRLHSHM